MAATTDLPAVEVHRKSLRLESSSVKERKSDSKSKSELAKNKSVNKKKKDICIEKCQVLTNEKVDFIQCSCCARWYHVSCIDLESDCSTAIWPCPTCRQTPKLVKDILTQLTKLTSRISEIHDTNELMIQSLSRKTAKCGELQETNKKLRQQLEQAKSISENNHNDPPATTPQLKAECLLIGSSIVGVPKKFVPKEVQVQWYLGVDID